MTNNFVRQPLEKKYNRHNIVSRLERIERQGTAKPSARVTDLAEFARVITGVRFVAVGNDGTRRMVMSGTELLDMGVAAHLAGFASDGTAQFYVDADDGTLKAGGGNVHLTNSGIAILEGNSGQAFLSFYDETGTVEQFAFKVANGSTAWQSEQAGGTFYIIQKLTDGSTPYIKWDEGATANTSHLEVNAGTDGGDAVFFGDITMDGTEHRLEVGQDHYLPNRNASNPNVFFNEANQDMDFTVEGTTDIVFKVDAGNNRAEISSLKAAGIVNDTGLAAGTYTPTVTAVANIDTCSANGASQYLRVGSSVIVWGSVNTDATTAGVVTRVGISLPIASNFTAGTDLAGTASNRTSGDVCNLNADDTNDRAELVFSPSVTGANPFRYMFGYQVM